MRRLLHHFRAHRRAGSHNTLNVAACFHHLRHGKQYVFGVHRHFALRRDPLDGNVRQLASNENFRQTQLFLPEKELN